ncbi:MAG TPA: hypothetical protein VK665_00245, partial [Candidatus Elarobacter sp.]|nr:hypothetical protein [Candidatus Elarobacter sp.]
MISRSTLIGALVVVELAIVGAAARAIAGDGPPSPPQVGFAPLAPHAPGGPRLDRTFATGLAPHIVVDVHDVDLYVRGENAVAVRAQETLERAGFVSGGVAQLSSQQTPDGLRFSASSSDGAHVVIGTFSHELHLTVPAGARVEV